MFGMLAAIWGYTGILFVFGSAIYRLTPVSWQLTEHTLLWYHWVALAVSLIFMGFAEGYRGFQQGYSPRVAARILYLSKHTTPVRFLLAPLFCMGFFHIERRRQIISYSLIVGIFLLVKFVHTLDQPWRGIIDAGVVLGLTWGIVSLTLFTFQAFSGDFDHSPEVPQPR